MPPSERDYSLGATFLLQITMNRILYNNVVRNLERNKDVIEYHISKYIKEHLSEETKMMVRQMRSEVEKISSKNHLDAPSAKPAAGKRLDHDSLPDEIKALYHENLNILQKERDLHTQLRIIARDPNVTCLDSEQFPFLKELIELDRKLRANWNEYDKYTPERYALEKEKLDSLKALRLINMYKGKYKKNPSEALKKKILAQLLIVANPADSLIVELKQLGVYEKGLERH